jgi:SAM-dependent methyltransferase
MANALRDSKARFSDRVEDYIKYRPRYQAEVLSAMQQACGLNPDHVIADVGCGTGFSAELFLRNGNRVIGIEPNPEMREAGEQYLASYPNFEMRDATAEQTGLGDASVDFVLAGQAFHWFRLPEARAEFARIVKPEGWIALIWHDRGTDGTPFLRAYEDFLHRYAIDYDRVQHRQVANSQVLERFFSPQEMRLISLRAQQRFDLDGLRGRLLSSSYIPREGERADAMLREFPEFFARFLADGHVVVEYETKIFYGHLRP